MNQKNELPPVNNKECAMLETGNTTDAVKAYKNRTNCSLEIAKQTIKNIKLYCSKNN